MSRVLTVGAAQLGPIQRGDGRAVAVGRMLDLMARAHARGCDVVVFPELTLTTFFARWYMEDQAEIDSWFEREMPGPETQPLFDAARAMGLGFSLGYAELAEEAGGVHRYNTAILVDKTGTIVGKYRKVHLPGHAEYDPARKFQHLEKRYFEVGDLGFPVWRTLGGVFGMCICNDRRWPETYRVMGLQGVEMVLLGYNTPTENALSDEPENLRMFHNHLSMQAGAYQNGTWVV
ncbi:MAG: N-carbamoyl-D-amino-acid hydrolase, partial [Proteobacteria bacterium]|nr:N-carbamoyl-D-amino-acid hydrolase [Pseudomonadota bacterium]